MNFDSSVLQIPVEDIIPNRFQPRLSFDDDGLNELADSIKQHGIIQPLVLRRIGDKYEIIAGERRYKAATMAGLASVPAVVSQIDDRKSAEVAVVENVQRKDLSAIEEAKSYKALLDLGYMSQEMLAKKMGLSQSAIANKLRLLNLCEEVQDAVMEGKISERHARALLSIKSEEDQIKWLNKIIDERLTVRQLDELLKQDYGSSGGESKTISEVKAMAVDIPKIEVNNNELSPSTNGGPINLGEKKEARFFNNLEEQEANMSMTEAINPFSAPSFMDFGPQTQAVFEENKPNDINVKNDEIIESLDFEPIVNNSPKFADAKEQIDFIKNQLSSKYIVNVSNNELDNEITFVITIKDE